MAGDERNETWSVTLDKDLRPAYYDQFHCLAADCRFTCCAGWHIPFDKKDYLALKHQKASLELRERLDVALRRIRNNRATNMYAEFSLPEGVCPLLREDGLCSLQAEKGPEALPAVCKEFPRGGRNLISGYRELSLSPACEGVLELLWNLPKGVDFVSDPLPREEWRKLTMEGDVALIQHFADIRELCVDFLQDRRFPLPRRMLMMGMALRNLEEGEKDVPAWLERSRSLAEGLAFEGFPEEPEEEREKLLAMFLANSIRILEASGTQNPQLDAVKGEVRAYCGLSLDSGTRGTLLTEPYKTARARFEENFGGRDYFFENLMVSLLFHLHIPTPISAELLWKDYVGLCNLYAIYRFAAVMSCREGAAGDRDELFRMMIFVSRALIHNNRWRGMLRDELFQTGSATLAHMAVLLSG